MTSLPGIYKMIGEEGEILYVGKAGNLKKRVRSYFTGQSTSRKTSALVKQIKHIEVTVTNTANEALILENNLIKQHQPRYNILMRDDKSYPYLYLSDHSFPRLGIHRGPRKGKGKYFGPYPSAGAVRESLNLMQKLFPVRQCSDSFYRNRSRPCLQYQIKRCTAPCVNKISVAEYANDVQRATHFLNGKNHLVIEELAASMDSAAQKLDYELAAQIRDQIAVFRRVQETQHIDKGSRDLDIIACKTEHGVACVQLFFIRGGRNLGGKALYPKCPGEESDEEVLAAFMPQFYLGKDIPPELVISPKLSEQTLLTEVLSEQAGRKIKISQQVRGVRLQWQRMAEQNAGQALSDRLASRANILSRYQALQDALQLDELPMRMECFDISHTGGEETVASCVVFDLHGPLKSDYRRFNIEGVTEGDDYAALAQAVERRYKRLKNGEGKYPDILIIDGGKGQLSVVSDVLRHLQSRPALVISVSKGPARKAGEEIVHFSDARPPLALGSDSAALHLIQQIRDEAHRFAITGHRQRRSKKQIRSEVENIPGFGPKRRQKLLSRFGGIQEVMRAGVGDLASVPGISRVLAQTLFDHFHGDKA